MNMVAKVLGIVLLLVAVRPGVAAERIFQSESGQVVLKVVPGRDGQSAQGTLTARKPGGGEEILWNKPLARFPARVFVSERHLSGVYVVALDAYWGISRVNSPPQVWGIVVYDPQGNVGRDFSVTGDAVRPRTVRQSWGDDFSASHRSRSPLSFVSERLWFAGDDANPAFLVEMQAVRHRWDTRVEMHFLHTGQLAIDLKTGRETVQENTKQVQWPALLESQRSREPKQDDPFVGTYHQGLLPGAAVGEYAIKKESGNYVLLEYDPTLARGGSCLGVFARVTASQLSDAIDGQTITVEKLKVDIGGRSVECKFLKIGNASRFTSYIQPGEALKLRNFLEQ